ncbi:transcriptional regulator [Thioclava sp. SK-1]|nr:transcriptional regulator [Thioclava sp. SK-1]
MDECAPKCQMPQGRRHAAGEDPEKRSQILNGAWKIFAQQGFDAASMNNICKAAGVSKGTIYVYFSDKQELLVALVTERRQKFLQEITSLLASHGSTQDRLLATALALGRLMTSDDVVRVQRMVIAVAERMPDLGRQFYDAGAQHFLGLMSNWLCAETQAGRLWTPDPVIAAQHFAELASAGIWRRRLFGHALDAPTHDAIDHVAQEAVRVFIAAYGPHHRPPAPR